MTLLLRMLEEHQQWVSFQGESDAHRSLSDVPSWAFREFTPTIRDKFGLSLFEIDEEDQAHLIAAAFAYHKEYIERGFIVFAVVDRQLIEARGLELRSTAGKLGHSYADAQHREVMIRNISDLNSVVECYVNGEYISVEGKVAAAAAKDAAKNNQFNYMPAATASISHSQNWRAKNIIKFIADKAVVVNGVSGNVSASGSRP
ncbi:hypothetical protein [Methylobacterium variabile]|jgi:hypothetical protein|uniref:hypothetical protein n=1 Tax=Methylobacterium variabile TaxID=298794 RepID=UPI0012EE4033|nr:hypothetical protein [Methylobacterium variabile]